MKKHVLFAFLAAILSADSAFSQNSDTASLPVRSGNEWRMPGDAVKRSQDFAGRLQKELGLDEEATKKVFQAHLANTKPVDEIRMGSGSEKEKADRMKANQAAFDETLKGILSPAQYAAYVAKANSRRTNAGSK